MAIEQIINVVAGLTLFEMMITIGLGVKIAEVTAVARDWGTLARAALANYVLIPAAAVLLLLLFHAAPLVAAGFLIAAVCPGAPYGPPFTAIAKGNVVLAVGLMVILAASSAFVAPLLLRLLLPFVSGDQPVQVDAVKIAATLLGAQLLPLCVGLLLRDRRPALADRLQKPARKLSLILNVVLLGAILVTHFDMLIAIPARGFAGMAALVAAALGAGWLLGGRKRDDRTAMAMAAAVRNVAVGLVIAMASFPGTPAIAATTAFALFQTIAMALVAATWGRLVTAPARATTL